MNYTRRTLLATLAATAAVHAKKKGQWDHALGAELYTVRTVVQGDPSGVISSIARMGYKEIECSTADLVKYAPLYKEFNLTAPAIHADTNVILNGDLSKIIDDAKSNGARFVVMPYLAPALRGTLDDYRKIADKMNAAGDACAKAGLQFAYHNHAFEFAGNRGERPWDVFIEKWDKKLVALELDVFWLSVAGLIPSDVIRQFTGRVPLVHLKDKAFGTPRQFTEKVEPSAFRAVGTGTLDFVSIIKACEKAGTQHYFVEQDQTPGPPLDSLRLSYNTIRALKFK